MKLTDTEKQKLLKVIDTALDPLTDKYKKDTNEVFQTLFGDTIFMRKDLVAEAILPVILEKVAEAEKRAKEIPCCGHSCCCNLPEKLKSKKG